MQPCQSCKYFVTMPEGAGTVCKRNPPTAFVVPMQIPASVGNPKGGMGLSVQSYFPPVLPDWGCGAWVTAPAAN